MKSVFKVMFVVGTLSVGFSSPAFSSQYVWLTSPSSGAVISGSSVSVSAGVAAGVDVKQIIFYRDSAVKLGTVTVKPYSVALDSTQISNGAHKLYAVVYDLDGTHATSSKIGVTVNNGISPSPSPSPSVSPSPSPSATVSPSPSPSSSPTSGLVGYSQALQMADFILKLQDSGGAIKDGPGGKICNEDSNMEYALLGLAAAYKKSGDPKYLAGFEKGIDWLAAREDMSTTQWRGSWYYTYSCSYPYSHVATSPGTGITDVRGVDTTSAYFAYLLYIHRQLTHSDTYVTKYAENAKSALNFVLQNNWSADGTSISSWQLINGAWVRWNYEYTADNADVYLGMRAGALLFDGATSYYKPYADGLQQKIPALFYDSAKGRYAEGRDGGALDWSNEPDALFPQGYAPWAIGGASVPANLAAYQWLSNRVQTDGSIVAYSGDPGYSLIVSNYLMAAATLGKNEPLNSANWLITVPFDSVTGGVHDTRDPSTDETNNIAGFTILGLFGQTAFDW